MSRHRFFVRSPPSQGLPLIERAKRVLELLPVVEPHVRSLVPEDGRAARVSAAVLASTAESSIRPLSGLLCGVKDIIQVDGLPTRCGSALPACAFDGAADLALENTAVKRARDAGAIILGKTTTTEFANFDAGSTTNPWDTRHSPGGSSQGSAAAVAAGLVDFAFGTQTGGSVNRPAAYNGIAAFKPSVGRAPRDGIVLNAHSLDTLGFFAAGGCALLARLAHVVLDGWGDSERAIPLGWGDRFLFGAAGGEGDPGRSAGGIVERDRDLWTGEMLAHCPIGVPDGPYLQQAAPRARESFEATAKRLSAAGVDVRRVPMLSEWESMSRAHSVIMHYETARNHVLSGRWPHYAALYRAGTAALIDRGLGLSEAEYCAALASRAPAADRVREAMDQAGVLAVLTPGATDVAPEGASNRWWTGDAGMQAVWTMFGWPILSLPSGVIGGLPVGIQLVMPQGMDESLLCLGVVLESLSTSEACGMWPYGALR
eukprot:scaffold26533_cov129-Isochrysis_galbana.AAC.1